jgi:hypothetical protein
MMINSYPTPSSRHIAGVPFASSAQAETLSHHKLTWRIRSAAGAFLAILLSMPGVAMQPAFGQETCLGDSYVPASSFPGGTIAVTDSAIMYSFSNCPTAKLRLGRPIRLHAGQTLFFWFRLQGDQAYLSTAQSRSPFVLNSYKDNGSVFVSDGLIVIGELDRSAMAAEAEGAGGVFDWRIGAKKWKFDVPGTYKILLSQQGSDIGCAGSLMSSQCYPVVEVVP